MLKKVEVKAEPKKTTRRENPYKTGSTGYIAYECGYMDALEDVKKLLDPDNMKYTLSSEEWNK